MYRKPFEPTIETMANAIRRYRLQLPASITLEAGQPIAFLGAQLVWLMQPALSLFIHQEKISQLATILEEPQAIEQLLRLLEEEPPPSGNRHYLDIKGEDK